MLDDDLKKILSDLKMDDLVKELEEPKKEEVLNPEPQIQTSHQKSRFSARHLLISSIALITIGLCSVAFMYKPNVPSEPTSGIIAQNDDVADADDDSDDQDQDQEPESDEYDYENPYKDRETIAASWAKKMVEIDPKMGQDLHELWDTLRQRKDDLEDAARELSDLLFDNARRRQDFYAKEAHVLLSRYQAIDARHTIKIANRINAIYAVIHKKHDPDLNQAYAEMLGELGAEMYTTHQVQISKELILQEMKYNIALQAVVESNSLKELHDNLQQAQDRLEEFENNGIMQTFSQIDVYEKQLAPSVKECLDRLLFDSSKEGMFQPEEATFLEAVLTGIGANDNDQKKYFDQFQRNVHKEEAAAPIIQVPTSKVV